MISRFFSRRWRLLTLLVAAAVIGMGSLGAWQLQRLGQRRTLNADLQARLDAPVVELTAAGADPAGLDFRRVQVQGTFDPGAEIILRNQARQDAPGVHLLTPLRLAGSDQAVLVDRGWIPYDAPATRYPAPGGVIAIEGIARAGQPRTGWLSPRDPALTAAMPRLQSWYRVDIARIQEQTPYPLLPVFVQQTGGFVSGALPAADVDIELSDGPHLSYAIQWFAFAATLLIGYPLLLQKAS